MTGMRKNQCCDFGEIACAAGGQQAGTEATLGQDAARALAAGGVMGHTVTRCCRLNLQPSTATHPEPAEAGPGPSIRPENSECVHDVKKQKHDSSALNHFRGGRGDVANGRCAY